jgi:hypothetical protein
MPIAPPTNPLLDLIYQQGAEVPGDTITREEMFEIQREQESRLLGTFFVQAIFLAMAILLYSSWQWSQFGEPYEAALFYGLMGFSLQAALYFSFRTLFEDSSNHRKELKRMKNRQKRTMATMSFQMRKMQTENLLHQQMGQYQAQMTMAQADGVIDNSEQAILQNTLNQIQGTAAASGLGNLNSAQDLESLARQLGIDRFRVGPIPLGPKLVLNPAPMNTLHVPPSNKLDLTPSNNNSLEAQVKEKLA